MIAKNEKSKCELVNEIINKFELSEEEKKNLWRKTSYELNCILNFDKKKYFKIFGDIKSNIESAMLFEYNNKSYVRIGNKCYRLSTNESLNFSDIKLDDIEKIYNKKGALLYQKETQGEH